MKMRGSGFWTPMLERKNVCVHEPINSTQCELGPKIEMDIADDGDLDSKCLQSLQGFRHVFIDGVGDGVSVEGIEGLGQRSVQVGF